MDSADTQAPVATLQVVSTATSSLVTPPVLHRSTAPRQASLGGFLSLEFAFSKILYKGTHTTCGLLCLASLAKRAFTVHVVAVSLVHSFLC